MRVALLSLLPLQAAAASPVDKVVELLKEMEGKIEKDGKAEQKIFDKYACWCEKTTARKAEDIKDGRQMIAGLQNHILSSKGKLESLAAAISELEAEIKSNNESQTKATNIREKENAEFQANAAELQEAIGALDKAIRVLSGAGTGNPGELAQVQQTLRSVIESVPGSVAGEKVSAVRQLISRTPTQFIQYAPQSATVQGILKDMYDTFTLNLEESSATEAGKQGMYEDYMHSKIKELTELTDVLSKREVSQSEAKKALAMAQQEREDAVELLEGDMQFFTDTKASCHRKATDWAERSRLRDEELDGVKKAIEILDSEDAKKLFESATSTFLQLSSSDSTAARRAAVLKTLQDQAHRTHLSGLLAVVARLRQGGQFDQVIAQIEKLMDKLREEEQQDIVDRDECIENENKHSNEKDDLEYEVKKLGNKIEKLEDRKLDLQDRIDAIHVGITDQTTVMEDALTVRTATHDEFLQAKSDDEAAIELLSQAIKVLGKFYKNNALLQRNEPLVKPPEFDEDPDRAPEANVDKKYEGSQRQNGGIVALLQHLKEQLQNEVAAAVKAEEEDTAAYEKQRVEDRQLREDLKQQAADLGEEKANTEQTITNTEEKKTDTQTHADDVGTELDRIKESCEWIRRTFDKRREMRKAEMKGLRDAKNLLAGQDPNSAFLQKKTHH
mmetsp:Transcript_44489/g.94871  ORF Transcript_44489/g.94871 Transcript_44489/m.94871 type:complete len:673 (+) Transcript_44489:122-2140(+)|eukprot:CAMPEP_0204252906 /NCGR_PEP_ID=MMETSP0468-20130131/1527_1 /ASSEMBLY_ACC=CAM_ASM_000383 /TAXON_ID=2969 /ORGANISM="Oxyrrhis marina" /LENGTH=672 /DNA_ID=CAMNT_0051226419 /DNA_START=122 /DNA_END=2140 /DNA_ORIENTATION=+